MHLSKRKGIYYVFYKQINGKKTCKSTHSRKKSDAYKYLMDFKKQLEIKLQNPAPTLNEFYKMYMGKAEVFLSKSSWRMTRSSFKAFMAHVGEEIKLNEISSTTCEMYLLDRFKVSKHGATLVYRHLKAAFNRSVSWELIEKNPFAKFKLPRIETKLPAYIDEQQLNLILELESNPILKANFAIAFFSGLRISELINLRWKDVDAVNKIIYVRNSEIHSTKSKHERIVPYGNKIEYYLSTLATRSQNEFVFSIDGKKKLQTGKVSKLFKAKVREAKLDEAIHYHSLRHSFASLLVSKNVPLYHVQKLLGHSSPSMTAIYSHLSSQNLADAIKMLD